MYKRLLLIAVTFDQDIDLLNEHISKEKFPYIHKYAKRNKPDLEKLFNLTCVTWEQGYFEQALEAIEQDLAEGKGMNNHCERLQKQYYANLQAKSKLEIA